MRLLKGGHQLGHQVAWGINKPGTVVMPGKAMRRGHQGISIRAGIINFLLYSLGPSK